METAKLKFKQPQRLWSLKTLAEVVFHALEIHVPCPLNVAANPKTCHAKDKWKTTTAIDRALMKAFDGAFYKQFILATDTQNHQFIHHEDVFCARIIYLCSHTITAAFEVFLSHCSRQDFDFLSLDGAFNVAILHHWHREWLFVMFSVALSFGKLRSPIYIIPLQNLPV